VTRLFVPILVLHVVVAVVGLGSILSVALMALRGIERFAYGVSALIAAITVLMEVKPF
jgi:hypothetical protein